MATMRTRRTHITYHPNAPKRLIREHARLKSARAIARFHRVNVRYVHDVLVRGIIPSNPNIAQALYCTTPALSKLQLGDGRRRHILWWRRLSRDQRNQIIHFMYHYKENQ